MILDLKQHRVRDFLAHKHVLVVEDEAFVADFTEMMLEELECRVIGPAPSEAAALRLIEQEHIDLAVLDVNLGDHKVYRVADRLEELNIPFVFTTGYDISALPPRYQRFAHIAKPLDEHNLARMLVRAIQNGATSENGNGCTAHHG